MEAAAALWCQRGKLRPGTEAREADAPWPFFFSSFLLVLPLLLLSRAGSGDDDGCGGRESDERGVRESSGSKTGIFIDKLHNELKPPP